MTLSGPDALRALDDALRDIRREEDEVAKRAARHAELLIKLRSQEAELYRQLGANRLEPGLRARQASQLAQINSAVNPASHATMPLSQMPRPDCSTSKRPWRAAMPIAARCNRRRHGGTPS